MSGVIVSRARKRKKGWVSEWGYRERERGSGQEREKKGEWDKREGMSE